MPRAYRCRTLFFFFCSLSLSLFVACGTLFFHFPWSTTARGHFLSLALFFLLIAPFFRKKKKETWRLSTPRREAGRGCAPLHVISDRGGVRRSMPVGPTDAAFVSLAPRCGGTQKNPLSVAFLFRRRLPHEKGLVQGKNGKKGAVAAKRPRNIFPLSSAPQSRGGAHPQRPSANVTSPHPKRKRENTKK